MAWTPDAASRTVVRGSYGIYYDQSALAPGEGLYFNAPYFNFNLFFPPRPQQPADAERPLPERLPAADAAVGV